MLIATVVSESLGRKRIKRGKERDSKVREEIPRTKPSTTHNFHSFQLIFLTRQQYFIGFKYSLERLMKRGCWRTEDL